MMKTMFGFSLAGAAWSAVAAVNRHAARRRPLFKNGKREKEGFIKEGGV
jgi:hypothetical protein